MADTPAYSPGDRARWAARVVAARHELARRLHGTVQLGTIVETRRARVLVAYGARPSVLRLTVSRFDGAVASVSVEMHVDLVDVSALAAIVRAACRPPWRARAGALFSRLTQLFQRKQA
ncbi:hypothetical protein [Streptomyces sp. NPDC053427]|uniref:hypothetical protein n=1 Tax=Streptomyces sp. NPDC053427 TaxID=3365701 RepID=UPI0037D6F962